MRDQRVPSGTLKATEYFAGIGLARLGLESAGIQVIWSNDIADRKMRMFNAHFGDDEGHTFHLGDLMNVHPTSMPQDADIAWASFPCTNLSLAGTRAGLHVGASSAFWLFIKNLARLGEARPPLLAIENVTGFVSSRNGKDIVSAIRALNGLGYSVDVLSLDARRFVPQSRPRLFLLAEQGEPIDFPDPSDLRPSWLDSIFADPSLRTHRNPLPSPPPLLTDGFSALAERVPESDTRWWSDERVEKFRASLSPLQESRLQDLLASPGATYRSAYRRMRGGIARWEVRADDIAGCLRTARGGSSRQAVVVSESGNLRIRWMTAYEYAALMGAPEYCLIGLPDSDVMWGFGDAVCVPVVRWLADNVLLPRSQAISYSSPNQHESDGALSA